MIWRWIAKSMDWRDLTRPTWKAPYTRLWWADLVLRTQYIRPLRERLSDPVRTLCR